MMEFLYSPWVAGSKLVICIAGDMFLLQATCLFVFEWLYSNAGVLYTHPQRS